MIPGVDLLGSGVLGYGTSSGINFSKLTRDAFGQMEYPLPILMKPHGEVIGPLGHAFGMSGEFKYSEPSTISFTYPKNVDGSPTPFYTKLVKDKIIRLEPFGTFVVASASEEGDGIRKVKTVELYSREYELTNKNVIFQAGTYNFWNPADQENSMLYIALSDARHWNIGYVSPSLIGRYRTFDETNTDVHSFLRNTAQESYGCVFLFDTYTRTVSAIDKDDEIPILPIYISYSNLLKSDQINELEDNFATKYYVQGADGVDIRNVNPTGDNYIYNLNWAISNGDLPTDVADKWRKWQNSIFAQQAYYTSLVALRNTATGQKVVEQARLTDMKNELATLDNERATFLQMKQKSEEGSSTYEYFEQRLSDTAVEYSDLEADIAKQETYIEELQTEIDKQVAALTAINDELSFDDYFDDAEKDILDPYLKFGTFTDATFATFDVAVDGVDEYASHETSTIDIEDVVWHAVECEGHQMAALKGGMVTLTGTTYVGAQVGSEYKLTGSILSGTWDHKDGKIVCSMYLGKGELNGTEFPSGNLTIVCGSDYDDAALLAGLTLNENTITSPDGTASHTSYYYTGDVSIEATDAAFYFSRNVTDYQEYSVSQELYEYADTKIKELASPTYEFEIEVVNLLAAKEFEPFRDALQLGSRCYLDLESVDMLTPILIEVHVDFDDPTNFSLVFANQFRRPSAVNSLKDTLKTVSTSTSNVERTKLKYGQNNNTTTWVKNLLDAGYNAALAQIMAGNNNLVTIDRMGITIGSSDNTDVIRLNNGMIALYDKTTNTVSMAMGRFLNAANNMEFVGILADVIGGTLLAGQNLIIECADPNGGVMQFKVDSSGVIINNGRLYMSTEDGKMGFDARWGFFVGQKDLFTTTDSGYVKPTCVDDDGSLILDDDGFPKGVNVWIGIDGKVYIRGTIHAEDGKFTGDVTARNFYFQDGDNVKTLLDQAQKKFDLSELDYIDLGYIQIDGTKGNINFSNAGSITWGSNAPSKSQFSPDGTSDWSDTMRVTDYYRRDWDYAADEWGSAYQFRGKNGSDGSDANVTWNNVKSALQRAGSTKQSFITANEIGSPNIYGGNIYAANIYAGDVDGDGNVTPDEESYTHMNGDGFHIYVEDATKPKVSITLVDSEESSGTKAPAIILGAGSSDIAGGDYDMVNRLFLVKDVTFTDIYYVSYTDASVRAGFRFNSDGTIEPIGTLKGVEATWG